MTSTKRFYCGSGGAILDRATGVLIARINVSDLDLRDAVRVAELFIDALEGGFGDEAKSPGGKP